MSPAPRPPSGVEPERYELLQPSAWSFELGRRAFLQTLGAGVLIAVLPEDAAAQERGRRREAALGERLHLGADGAVTILCGKVEVGQGARTQIAMAAAEELRVALADVQVVLADSDVVPDDGGTYGSRTTPSTVPAVRAACAAARELLVATAARRFGAEPARLAVKDGMVRDPAQERVLAYSDLAELADVDLERHPVGSDVRITPVAEWTVLGRPAPIAGGRAIVRGEHRYPSDVVRPGMLHAAVLRPPSFGAALESLDLEPARALPGVVAVQDGGFVGFAAPTSHSARKARDAVEPTARWKSAPGPAHEELYDRLVKSGTRGGGRSQPRERGNPEQAFASAARVERQRYHVAYVQHAPMEPRAAVAEWSERGLAVWTGTQNPGRVREELMQAFRLPPERVRVVVPDAGGAFGGKHTGEAAVEAARIAREAGRPVSLQWSREEEFTWAYFRPAGVIEVAAGLRADGRIEAWEQRNWNSGGSALETPYAVAHVRSESLASDAPLRQGSYRALAATANTFARESFLDELARLAGADPLDYRRSHLEDERLRAVLGRAAERFEWVRRRGEPRDHASRGVGLACGVEKGGYAAACVEVAVDAAAGRYRVVEIVEAFECGAIQNPANLRAQVEGCIVQGLGGALTEEIRFRDGRIENAAFARYRVPRFGDLPRVETVLVDRPDLPSAGAGETPIIAVAPAVANALCAATGARIRSMPIRDERLAAR